MPGGFFNLYNMKVFVLSMDNEIGEERRRRINYEYEWIKAVDLDEKYKERFVFRYNTLEKNKKGVYGCFAGHLHILKKIIDEKIDSVIICEDDAILVDIPDLKDVNEICLLSGRIHHPKNWCEDKDFQKNTADNIKFNKGMNVIDYDKYRWAGAGAIYYPTYEKALELYESIMNIKRWKHFDILLCNSKLINHLYYPSPFAICDFNKSQIVSPQGLVYNYRINKYKSLEEIFNNCICLKNSVVTIK